MPRRGAAAEPLARKRRGLLKTLEQAQFGIHLAVTDATGATVDGVDVRCPPPIATFITLLDEYTAHRSIAPRR